MSNQTHNYKPESGNIELFQIELTKAQLKALSSMLPQGFALEAPKKHNKKEIEHPTTKKFFTNEGHLLTKKPSKPADYANENILINKHALRDPNKRKLSHFEVKYPDFEPIPTTSSKSSKSNNDAIRKCHNLLQKLKKHTAAGPFLYPVDVVGLGLTDYYDIVHEPMDLSTVEHQLKTNQYSSVAQFAADIRKIWNNAFLYNLQGTQIHYMTMEMSAYFEKLFRDIENLSFNDTVRDLEKKVEMLSKQITELHQKGLTSASDVPKLVRSTGSKTNKNAKTVEKPLTSQEKRILGENIKNLPPEHLRGVWDIVSQRLNKGNNQEEIVFDIESLPVKVARELERFVKHKIGLVNRSKNKNKAKELTIPRPIIHPSSSNQKQLQQDYHHQAMRTEEDLPTHHHSMIGTDEIMEIGNNLNRQDDASSNSSESSFISDSDSDGEDNFKAKKDNVRVAF
jgi:hypothetical protein